MYFDTPRDYISGVYDSLLYGDQPIGWDIIGRKETVRGATRDTFLGYIDSGTSPERMVVGVAGKLDADLQADIERLLGDLEPAETGTPAPAQFDGERRRAGQDPHEGVGPGPLCLGVPSYPLDHPDRYALQLLSTTLGTGMSSRLFTEVRERRGLAYYIYAVNHSYTDVGSLFSQAGRRHRADRRGDHDDLRRAEEDHRRGRAVGRAREGAQRREGAVRPPDGEPARADHVRAPARGARRAGGRAGGDPRRARRGHGRGRAAGRAGRDRRPRAEPRA